MSNHLLIRDELIAHSCQDLSRKVIKISKKAAKLFLEIV